MGKISLFHGMNISQFIQSLSYKQVLTLFIGFCHYKQKKIIVLYISLFSGVFLSVILISHFHQQYL